MLYLTQADFTFDTRYSSHLCLTCDISLGGHEITLETEALDCPSCGTRVIPCIDSAMAFLIKDRKEDMILDTLVRGDTVVLENTKGESLGTFTVSGRSDNGMVTVYGSSMNGNLYESNGKTYLRQYKGWEIKGSDMPVTVYVELE